MQFMNFPREITNVISQDLNTRDATNFSAASKELNSIDFLKNRQELNAKRAQSLEDIFGDQVSIPELIDTFENFSNEVQQSFSYKNIGEITDTALKLMDNLKAEQTALKNQYWAKHKSEDQIPDVEHAKSLKTIRVKLAIIKLQLEIATSKDEKRVLNGTVLDSVQKFDLVDQYKRNALVDGSRLEHPAEKVAALFTSEPIAMSKHVNTLHDTEIAFILDHDAKAKFARQN